MNATYLEPGGSEHMLSVGEDAATQIILLSPLFEEANRMRKTLVDILHGLGALGFGVVLPDMPGMGESVKPIVDSMFQDWQAAVRAVVDGRRARAQAVLIASFRGGALLDAAAPTDGVWRLAEETGARLLRDLSRSILARGQRNRAGNDFDLAGYALPPLFVDDLEKALPQPLTKSRSVRLHQDTNEADARIQGAPLWRRAEPGEDDVLTQAIVNDIADWARVCAQS